MALHQTDVEQLIVDEDYTSLQEAARNRAKVWRQQAVRGVAGARFSKAVKSAYRDTCLFTGDYLPATAEFGPGGVDSAHILPWADYELNKVSNGLCLNKLCHWAFDAGILNLQYRSKSSEYVLTLSEMATNAEKEKKINLQPFHALEGAIPSSRLPMDRADWPNPEFLRRYGLSFLA
jgi:predicted restriction endonuclease